MLPVNRLTINSLICWILHEWILFLMNQAEILFCLNAEVLFSFSLSVLWKKSERAQKHLQKKKSTEHRDVLFKCARVWVCLLEVDGDHVVSSKRKLRQRITRPSFCTRWCKESTGRRRWDACSFQSYLPLNIQSSTLPWMNYHREWQTCFFRSVISQLTHVQIDTQKGFTRMCPSVIACCWSVVCNPGEQAA